MTRRARKCRKKVTFLWCKEGEHGRSRFTLALRVEHAPLENDQAFNFAVPRPESGLDIAAVPSADDATRLYSASCNRMQLRAAAIFRTLFHSQVWRLEEWRRSAVKWETSECLNEESCGVAFGKRENGSAKISISREEHVDFGRHVVFYAQRPIIRLRSYLPRNSVYIKVLHRAEAKFYGCNETRIYVYL